MNQPLTTYGCHNKPRPSAKRTYLAQAGYENPVPMGWDTYSREPVYVEINGAFGSTDCQYTQQHANDPHCSGCVHRAHTVA